MLNLSSTFCMVTHFKKGDALLVVDAQIDFFPGGSLPVPHGHEVIPVINKWLKNAAQHHIPVYVSRDWHPADHCSFKEQGGIWPVHCVQDTEGADFHPDINIPSDVKIINKAVHPEKESYSAFGGETEAGEAFDKDLKKLKINRLFINGLAQDYCVLETALDARRKGYEVHLIVEGTKPVQPEKGEEALSKMQQAGVIFETS